MRLLAITIPAILLLSCGPGAVGKKVAGPPPAAADNYGPEQLCPETGAPDYAKPLIVDMAASERGDLELAMDDGLVVVRYDCNSLAVLPDCTANAEYRFSAFNPKSEVIRFDNAGEVNANFPVSAGSFGAKLGAEFARGNKLDVALAMVGKQRTTTAMLSQNELIEARPGACSEATHFVRGATLGAFALATSSSASIGGAAEVFGIPQVGQIGVGGSSSTDQSLQGKDGHISACEGASKANTQPPMDCSALLRLELTAVDPEGTPSQVARSEFDSCPTGLVEQSGKCTLPSEAPHLCRPDDVADCTAQCDAGDPGSCGRLGLYHQEGLNGVTPDPAQAATLYRKACDGGWTLGCASLGSLHVMGMGVPQDTEAGIALVEQACDEGFAQSCTLLGGAFYTGNLVPKDAARARPVLERACYGGDPDGCFLLGELHRKGLAGLSASGEQARAHYSMGCNGNSAMSCYSLAVAMEDGVGGEADPSGAQSLFERACKQNFEPACKELSAP